jgi:hypothetical protein
VAAARGGAAAAGCSGPSAPGNWARQAPRAVRRGEGGRPERRVQLRGGGVRDGDEDGVGDAGGGGEGPAEGAEGADGGDPGSPRAADPPVPAEGAGASLPAHVGRDKTYLPRWSPDGRRIAYVCDSPGKMPRIYVVDAEGGKPRPALTGSRIEIDPTWSPDGKRLLFSTLPSRTRKDPIANWTGRGVDWEDAQGQADLPEADLVAVREENGGRDPLAPPERPVLASEVLEGCMPAFDSDPRVTARDAR